MPEDRYLARARDVVARLGPAFCRTDEARDRCATCQSSVREVAEALRLEAVDAFGDGVRAAGVALDPYLGRGDTDAIRHADTRARAADELAQLERRGRA